MDRQKIEELFAEYENAFATLDLAAIAKYYPDTFISAGPKGTIAQSKKDFESKAEQAAEMYRSIGQNSGKILSKRVTPISNEYCLITVHWGTTYEKTGDEMVEFDVSYLVQQIDDKLSIILFITHEDEAEAMKKLGLKPENIK